MKHAQIPISTGCLAVVASLALLWIASIFLQLNRSGEVPGARLSIPGGDELETGGTPLLSLSPGVTLEELTPEISQRLCLPTAAVAVVVKDVQRRSPWADAGLQPGDVIIRLPARDGCLPAARRTGDKGSTEGPAPLRLADSGSASAGIPGWPRASSHSPRKRPSSIFVREYRDLSKILDAWPFLLVLLVLLVLAFREMRRLRLSMESPRKPAKAMSLRLAETDGIKLLVAHVRQDLSAGDYDRLILEMDRTTTRHGKICLLLDARNAAMRKAKSPMWNDLGLGPEPFDLVERVAVLFGPKREEWMTSFCIPFSAAEVGYFDRGEVVQAFQWLIRSLGRQRSLGTPQLES